MGGLLIFVLFVLGIFFVAGFKPFLLLWPFWAGILIFVALGCYDDLRQASPFLKLLVQVIVYCMLIFTGKIFVEWDILFGASSILPIFLNQVLTLIFMLCMVNAYNVIDGADGVAGAVALFFLTVVSCCFYEAGALMYLTVSVMLGAAVMGFMVFNWAPARIFMGDTGSYCIGLSCAFLTLVLLDGNQTNTGFIYEVNNPLSMLLAAFAFPIFDFTRVVLLRLWKGKHLFKADILHVNSMLMGKRWSHTQIAGSVAVFTGFIFCITKFLCLYLTDCLSLLGLFVIGFIIHFSLGYWVTQE